jgi:hypothetical protein
MAKDIEMRILVDVGMRLSNCVQSARCPGVMIREGGRQQPSALRWGLVENRPASGPDPHLPAPPPPGGRRGSATASRPVVASSGKPRTVDDAPSWASAGKTLEMTGHTFTTAPALTECLISKGPLS